MSNGQSPDVRDLITALRVDLEKHMTQSNADHKHLARTVETHIEKDDMWKENTDAQIGAIGNALLEDHARSSTKKQTKKEIAGYWYCVAVVAATLLANLLPKWLF